MLFSHLSKFASQIKSANKKESSGQSEACNLPPALTIITFLMRIIVGLTFIFSGFAKSVDPWGTIYKMNDYLAAMHLEIWPNLIIAGAFILNTIEFLVGVFIITGCFRKGAPAIGFLIICFMTPLTLWIALFDPVPDCGCFGDAIKLSNWATFWKNIFLFLCFLWLLKFNKLIAAFISPSIQWLGVLASLAYIGIIESAGFFYQPLIDFRPFKSGTELVASDILESQEEPDLIFTYRNGEITQDFTIDSLPDEDEGWEFVERKEIKSIKHLVGNKDIHSSNKSAFHIWENDEDVTAGILNDNPNLIILLMPKLSNVSIAQTWKINYLYDWANSIGYDFIAVVSGSQAEIDNWKDLSMPEYQIFTSDDTSIKGVARGNPALVALKDGKIEWKTALRSIELSNFKTGKIPVAGSLNPFSLRETTVAYISIMALLMMVSLVFSLRGNFHKKKNTDKTEQKI